MTEPSQPGQEHRKYPRVKTGVQVELKTEGATVASRTETADLSVGGCYIEMSFTFPVGTKLDLVLWVEDERVPTRAVVVTHHQQFGNGIQFVDLSLDDQGKLDRYIRKCEAAAKEKPEAEASGPGT
jgi:hypothetical protein